ncbi:DUF302 domain-containing protein [Tengunoibacter tsumagoiensis]|uniref:Membrane protein n=1 Tax=Tengunoibacter tsumagoiensis TaxID=2014871 RepID=A0A401ZZX0_9CHLR|nr:DUF302 domain-containing protein [Tengunoibacter tsumagoiensis]GCE12404.1 membrane protein [Tengunoibacter tsumagoiensis]
MNQPTLSGIPPSAEGVITRRSPFAVLETIDRLQKAMESHHLTIFAHIDHSEGARRVGLEMQEAHVLLFGNPRSGTPLMVASPLLALDLPLKVLIWQQDKHVWVSSIDPTYLQKRYALSPELIGNIAGSETLIEQTLAAHEP